jgi:hypothetical protein
MRNSLKAEINQVKHIIMHDYHKGANTELKYKHDQGFNPAILKGN